MLLIKFGTLTSRFACRNLLQRYFAIQNRRTFKSDKDKVTEVDDSDDEDNTPIPYSSSPAATWAARYSQKGCNDDDVPWFQPYVVSFSVSIFLLYFCVWRESNDIDDIFDMELGDHFIDGDKNSFKKEAGVPFDNYQKFQKLKE